jgi:hypothetical protein
MVSLSSSIFLISPGEDQKPLSLTIVNEVIAGPFEDLKKCGISTLRQTEVIVAAFPITYTKQPSLSWSLGSMSGVGQPIASLTNTSTTTGTRKVSSTTVRDS